jgi:hypothetical protein
MKLLRFILPVLLVGFSCSANPTEGVATPCPGEEGFVDEFLQSFRHSEIGRGATLLIHPSNSLWGLEVWKPREELFQSLLDWSIVQDEDVHEAMQDFCSRNSSASDFDPPGGLSFDYEIWSAKKTPADSEFDADEYQRIIDLLDSASSAPSSELIFISQPGFNAEGTIAIIYCATHRGPLDASGGIYILESVGGSWVTSKLSFGICWVS